MIEENLFITEVKTIKSDRYTLEWSRYREDTIYTEQGSVVDVPVIKECIRARRYINREGRVIGVGLSQEVEEALGVVFEVYEKAQRDLEVRTRQRDYVSKKLEKANIENWNLHRRLDILQRSWSYRIKKIITDYLEML